MGQLSKRLAALEARPQAALAHEMKTDWVALRLAFAEVKVRSEAPKPGGAAGVRHYRKEIAEAEHWASVVPPPDEPGKTNFVALRAAFMPKAIPGHRHDLRRCELQILEPEAFDPVRLADWRREHDRYCGIPWQWRGAELPADALAVIDAALARENSGDMHDDKESTK